MIRHCLAGAVLVLAATGAGAGFAAPAGAAAGTSDYLCSVIQKKAKTGQKEKAPHKHKTAKKHKTVKKRHAAKQKARGDKVRSQKAVKKAKIREKGHREARAPGGAQVLGWMCTPVKGNPVYVTIAALRPFMSQVAWCRTVKTRPMAGQNGKLIVEGENCWTNESVR